MKKEDKLKIIDDLIERTAILRYSNSSPEDPIIDEALSFIRNVIEKSNATVWDERIKNIPWYSISEGGPAFWESGKSELLGVLLSIKNEIELYTKDEKETILTTNEKDVNNPIIFLSHCSEDKSYGNALQKFIIRLGVKNNQLIYTSHPLHKIPLDSNIYDYLRMNINTKNLMIFLWSDSYLESPACMNEMGAAWVTQSDYTNIYVPNFSFGNPKYHECAVDTHKMGAVLKGDNHCKTAMIELKDKILALFGLSVEEKQATYLLDEFIEEILEINKQ